MSRRLVEREKYRKMMSVCKYICSKIARREMQMCSDDKVLVRRQSDKEFDT
jgi:heme oxygenase